MDLNLEKKILHRTHFALKIVCKMGKLLKKRYFSGTIQSFFKEDNEIVTEYDLLIDKTIKKNLINRFQDNWLSEESESIENHSEFEWVLDPVDGTNNFSFRVPFYCISLALKYKKETVAGIVHDPLHQTTYLALFKQSYIVQKKKWIPIKLSPLLLKDSMVSYGFHPDSIKHLEEFYQEWLIIDHQSKASRRLGSAALEIAYVGAGKLSIYWIIGYKEWDVAAALLFAANAGAKYKVNTDKKYLIVYNPMVEKDIEKLIKALDHHH